ncbi:ABC transporter permease subunit [Salinibacterium sp. ZJ70]|uniref:ABC transporter permease subunit n=1 Tax=Salinibacterium sp. ZJ70 TaxID=2708084 RepID=UPI00142200DD|nr:ABC transporter permease subunit [Salinibacterium sp. ZJ70]
MIDRRRVAAVVRKDLREILRNPQLVAPLVVVPLLFTVVFPIAIILLGNNPAIMASVNGLGAFLDNLPEGIVPAHFTEQQTIVYAAIVFFLAPMFLIVPVMFSSVIASSSFVGEKERRTLEGLLYTPLTNRELVLAKVLVSVIPAVIVSWAAFVIYALIVNVLGNPVIGDAFFPTATWILMILLLVPLVAILSTSLTVAVSGRATTMQGAQSVAVIIVLPVVGLVVSQATGLMLFDVSVVLVAIGVLAVVDAIVFLAVARTFQRERIITRL